MKKDKLSLIENLIYDYEEREEIIACLTSIDDPKMLHVYMQNYNWGDGFEIPQAIIDSGKIELATAMLMFYKADGVNFLFDKAGNPKLPKWTSFIKELYCNILHHKFAVGEIGYIIPLSKIEKYKLDKALEINEAIFLQDIDGELLDILI